MIWRNDRVLVRENNLLWLSAKVCTPLSQTLNFLNEEGKKRNVFYVLGSFIITSNKNGQTVYAIFLLFPFENHRGCKFLQCCLKLAKSYGLTHKNGRSLKK